MSTETGDATVGPGPDSAQPATPTTGPVFWVAMAVGGAMVGFGAVGLLTADGNALGSFIPWFAGGALLVDLVIIPIAAGAGLVGRRVLPAWSWPAARAALLATAVLVAFTLPLLLDLGGRPDNLSLRPRAYSTGLLVTVAAVWAFALAAALAGRAGARMDAKGPRIGASSTGATERPLRAKDRACLVGRADQPDRASPSSPIRSSSKGPVH